MRRFNAFLFTTCLILSLLTGCGAAPADASSGQGTGKLQVVVTIFPAYESSPCC